MTEDSKREYHSLLPLLFFSLAVNEANIPATPSNLLSIFFRSLPIRIKIATSKINTIT